MDKKSPTLSELNQKLKQLTDYTYITFTPKVQAAINEVRKENAPLVAELERQIKALQSKRKPTTRWPDNVPENIMTICNDYWNGTVEYWKFRIHLWNDKAVWTSYPSGGYSTAGGWNPSPACYYMLSLTEKEYNKPKQLKELSFEHKSGQRVMKTMMQEELDKL